MINMVRTVLTIVILAGFGLNLLTQWGGGQAKAAVNHGLDDDAQEFATQCEQTLDMNDHDFAAKVSVSDGCACLARELTQTYRADLVAAQILLTGVVETPLHSPMAGPDWSGIANQAGMTDAALGALLQSSYAALGTCGQA
ncbi:MAG: hypothetical protein AAFP85_07645 [Pseudomonadota bacterium]